MDHNKACRAYGHSGRAEWLPQQKSEQRHGLTTGPWLARKIASPYPGRRPQAVSIIGEREAKSEAP
jgi:hypothetical protein